MSVAVVLISHGKMAEGVKDSAELILGATEGILTESLLAGQDIEAFKKRVAETIVKADTGEGVLVFVDLFGASPYNASLYAKNELEPEGKKISIVTGMNLSMVLEVCAMRNDLDLETLAKMAISSGKEGIQEPVIVSSSDDDDY